MPKRTTILLEDELYERLVEESLRRYGTAKALSRVINELLKRVFRDESELVGLLSAEKVAKVSTKEFERFRRRLSRRLET